MLLWNLRRSGNNVLRYVKNYVDTNARNTRFNNNEQMTSYYADRWVSYAPNQVDGSGSFGRKSQRAVVLQAITALINENQQIRDEDSRQFNLLACPGYLETLSALVDLNTSRGETAFIVADTPARLTADATTLSNWGQNVDLAAIDGENGLIATNSYAAVYYPWGYTTDLLGNNIVVPPSHIMLRTIALSDNVSYPWFAPAGVRRGGVTNASSVGYVDAQTGEFITVALNTGQRDTLAGVHVNPITYIAGTGLVAYGQKTRQLIASSLDRINVARLVIYLRYQLNQIAKPFVFEPNDTITRNEIKQQIEKMLLELTGQRALYDYIVVCDSSNNTPARIDANELHVDIAIEPVKAVEFIYIPMRLENTGAIKGL
jgi:phage tail sheath protein FI